MKIERVEPARSPYGAFPEVVDRDWVGRWCHLSEADLGLVRRHRSDTTRLGFATQLVTVRAIGTFLAEPADVPEAIVESVSAQLGVQDPGLLISYAKMPMRWRHSTDIRERYGYQDFNDAAVRSQFDRWLYRIVWSDDIGPSSLFEVSHRKLLADRIVLPGQQVLVRAIGALRERATRRLWSRLSALVTADQAAVLNELLLVPEGRRNSGLDRLRRSPVNPTVEGLVKALTRLEEVRSLGLTEVDLGRLPRRRVATLARYGEDAWVAQLADLAPERRTATLVAFIHALSESARDDVLDVFDRVFGDMQRSAHNRGQKRRVAELRTYDRAVGEIRTALDQILSVIDDPDQMVEAVGQLRQDRDRLDGAIQTVDDLWRAPGDPFHDRLVAAYAQIRRFLPQFMKSITLASTDQSAHVLQALNALGERFDNQPRTTRRPIDEIPTGVLTASWEPYVIDPDTGLVDRAAYTCCVLDQLRVGLRRRDIYIDDSIRWGDPRAELIDDDVWDQQRDQACAGLALDPDAGNVISRLSQALDGAWRRLEEGMDTNDDFRIDYHVELPLAQEAWGGGEMASADGMRLVIPVSTIHAGYNPRYFGRQRASTLYTWMADTHAAFHQTLIPGTHRDSLYALDGLLANPTTIKPETVSTDTAGASEIVFALAWALGYRFAPRLADLADHKLWRIDRTADYGRLDGLARNRINTKLIASEWDQICRLTASLEARTVTPSAILRTLQRGPNPSTLARALVELGRVIKTLHILNYCEDPIYRRDIGRILNRGESRNGLSRETFHGSRGELRQRYQTGQENQLGALGLMVNIIVLWQTVYIQSALDHLQDQGHEIDPIDVARLSPLGHPTINLKGRYHTTSRPPPTTYAPSERRRNSSSTQDPAPILVIPHNLDVASRSLLSKPRHMGRLFRSAYRRARRRTEAGSAEAPSESYVHFKGVDDVVLVSGCLIGMLDSPTKAALELRQVGGASDSVPISNWYKRSSSVSDDALDYFAVTVDHAAIGKAAEGRIVVPGVYSSEWTRLPKTKAVGIPPDEAVEVCCACNGTRLEPVGIRHGLTMVRCGECGLVFTNPRPTAAAVLARYSEKYFATEYLDSQEETRELVQHWDNLLDVVEQLRTTKAQFFEIGFGAGGLLKRAEGRGWVVSGNDVNAAAVKHAKGRGLAVELGNADVLESLPSRFSCVVSEMSLEHMRDPAHVIGVSGRSLKPGGGLLIYTVSAEGRSFMEEGMASYLIGPAEHLFLFSSDSLVRLCSKAGLRVSNLWIGPEGNEIGVLAMKPLETRHLRA